MSIRLARPHAALLGRLISTATTPHPSVRCRLGLHRYLPVGTDPASPWMVLADECACGAQRPLPL